MAGTPTRLGSPCHHGSVDLRTLRTAKGVKLLRLQGCRRVNRMPVLFAGREKEGLWKNVKQLFKPDPDSHKYERTSPYLKTLDKRRGYHRDSLGGRIKRGKGVNGAESSVSPEKVAEATLGKFASQAFM